MRLLQLELNRLGPFVSVALPFANEEGNARPVTVVHGGGGVGKTTVLSALAATRPGYTVVPAPGGFAVTQWLLGIDDPDRPHPLTVASPAQNIRVMEADEAELLRRREQALFERRARDGGFAFLAIGASRWFSRQPIYIGPPARGVMSYDVRSAVALDDASRMDLTRDTKQALAYAEITRALARGRADLQASLLLGETMRAVVDGLVRLAGVRYEGVDARTLEPMFISASGEHRRFDALPTRARHLVAFGALPVRLLAAAYPGRDPRTSEGVVAIDEVDMLQDQSVQERLLPTLEAELPNVQWIVTTSSPVVSASRDARDVIALRRGAVDESVELYVGPAARTH